MGKRVRHVHAGPNEWVRVHRHGQRGSGGARQGGNSGSGGGDAGWGGLIVLVLFVVFIGGCLRGC